MASPPPTPLPLSLQTPPPSHTPISPPPHSTTPLLPSSDPLVSAVPSLLRPHKNNMNKTRPNAKTRRIPSPVQPRSFPNHLHEFKLELDSTDVVITQDLVKRALKHLSANPDAPRRFFLNVSDAESSKVSLDKMACALVCDMIWRQGWGDWVEERLRNLEVSYSSELVSMILRELGASRNEVEAMRFFRWLQGSNLFEYDERTYNAMLRVLGNVCGRGWGGIEFRRVVDVYKFYIRLKIN